MEPLYPMSWSAFNVRSIIGRTNGFDHEDSKTRNDSTRPDRTGWVV